MIKIVQSEAFDKWFSKLKDREAKIVILKRLKRFQLGQLGDVKYIQDDIYEMRIFTGKGYRIYYTQQGKEIIILLIGGDKSTQKRDIEKALKMKKDYSND